MNLKETLNLPKTSFPMRADLVKREPERVRKWQEGKVYSLIQKKNAGKKPFILHDGPPFTNGYVHIGTAFNKILKDIIIRYKTMRGFRTPYVPGWDCHGLPIEHKVVKKLHENKQSFDTISLRNECANFSKGFIVKQRAQFERLGILADWDNDYKTLDPAYEESVLNFFADCVAQNLVYRGQKPVYWSIPCKTALAEAEVEYKEHECKSIWVKFRFSREGEEFLKSDIPVYAVIWTTTPWTIPSNLAIAVHPELNYVVARCNDESYLVCETRLSDFLKSCHITEHNITAKFKGSDLEGLSTKHPFINRESQIVLANYVTTDSGTGCVHIAPGHGLEDYATGLAYKMDIYCPVDDDGKYIDDGQMPIDLVGLSVLDDGKSCEASDKVIEKLKQCGALLAEERYVHQYPHCWRSKTPVIFRAVKQWFISLDKGNLRQKMQEAVGEVRWTPSWGENRMRAAIDSRTDWCISRQRAWGTPLPVFYDNEGNALLDEKVIRKIAQKIGQLGSDFWFKASEEELLDGIELPDGWDAKKLKKCTDTLDVWIDSGNSHQAVLKKNPNLSWPADVYLEGSDQHRGWFQSSMWTSIISGNDSAPFKNVLTHGFIVDENKKKISKSDGKPQTADDYVNKFGTDVVRLWTASEDFRNDIPISEDIMGHIAATYRTIRNTLRFQIGNLFDFDPQKNAVEQSKMTLIDKWVLQKTKHLLEDAEIAYERYDFHRVYQLTNRFCSVELSAIYHDILKDRLYTFPSDSYERRSSQTCISIIFKTLISILAPILTFTCDEALAYFTSDSDFAGQYVHLLDWPDPDLMQDFEKEEKDFDGLLEFRSKVNEQLERARQSKFIGQSLDAKVSIKISKNDKTAILLKMYLDILPVVFIVSQAGIFETDDDGICEVTILAADGERCPRSWKWVDRLVDAGEFGKVSEKSYEALKEKYPELVK